METWPEALQPAICKWGRSRNDLSQESPASRRRKIVRRGRPLWTAEITWRLAPQNVAEARWQLEQLRGTASSVRLRDYAAMSPNVTNTITVRVAGSETATSVDTQGWSASTTGVVAAGQYVSINDYLYLVSASANSNGSGHATISLKTPLLGDVAIGDAVLVNTPYCLMRLRTQSWSTSRSADDGLTTLACTFVERSGGTGNLDGDAITLLG